MSKCIRGIRIKAAISLFFLSVLTLVFFGRLLAQEQKGATADTGGIPLKPEVSYGAENLRDPFKRSIQHEMLTQPEPATTEVLLPVLKVQGIFWGANFPQAIINDKIVKVGDTVDGVQVVSIEKNLVTVFYGNKQFKLSSPAADNLTKLSKKGKKEGLNEN